MDGEFARLLGWLGTQGLRALIGLLLGLVTYRMLKSVDNYQVEVLLTLALVMGGYALASALHTSGPIAIVCA